MIRSIKKISVFIIMAILLTMLPSISTVSAASTKPIITSPANKAMLIAGKAVTIRWEAPTGTIDHYTISVRHLSNGQDKVGNLILSKTNVPASASYCVLGWEKLERGSAYRVSISAVFTNGTQKWSNEVYFFTTTNDVTHKYPISFYVDSYDFEPASKNAIYYAAQTWNSVLGLGKEVVNTYPFNQTTIVAFAEDGKNSIMSDGEIGIPNYTMATRTYFKSGTYTGKEWDINVNEAGKDWCNGAQSGKLDIQSSMTHEMGHVIGLAHNYETFAETWTMYGYGKKNDISRRTPEATESNLARNLYN